MCFVKFINSFYVEFGKAVIIVRQTFEIMIFNKIILGRKYSETCDLGPPMEPQKVVLYEIWSFIRTVHNFTAGVSFFWKWQFFGNMIWGDSYYHNT